MKTVIDAVNEFNGVAPVDSELGSNYEQFIVSLSDFDRFSCGDISVGNGVRSGGKYWDVICTTEEFNRCVAEMSEGLFVPEADKPNLVYDKDGNGYEVGKFYCDEVGRIGALKSIDQDHELQFALKTKDSLGSTAWPCSKIEVVDFEAGTITPPKVKLVDGQAYEFECTFGTKVGLYSANNNSFAFVTGSFAAQECTNIIPLVKG